MDKDIKNICGIIDSKEFHPTDLLVLADRFYELDDWQISDNLRSIFQSDKDPKYSDISKLIWWYGYINHKGIYRKDEVSIEMISLMKNGSLPLDFVKFSKRSEAYLCLAKVLHLAKEKGI